jgi:transposase InsO family protein
MCKVLGLRKSNYYRWRSQRNRRLSLKLDELILVKKIEDVFASSKNTYGYRKIQKALEKEDIIISEYKIRRVMRENGLYPITTTKYKPYRNGKTNGQFSKNLLDTH